MMAINLSAQRNMTIVLPKHTSKTMQTIKIQQPTMNGSSKPKKQAK